MKKKRSIDFQEELLTQAEEICNESGLSVSGLINQLLKEAIYSKEQRGYFVQPFNVVPRNDYERFEAWEREENGKADKRETA